MPPPFSALESFLALLRMAMTPCRSPVTHAVDSSLIVSMPPTRAPAARSTCVAPRHPASMAMPSAVKPFRFVALGSPPFWSIQSSSSAHPSTVAAITTLDLRSNPAGKFMSTPHWMNRLALMSSLFSMRSLTCEASHCARPSRRRALTAFDTSSAPRSLSNLTTASSASVSMAVYSGVSPLASGECKSAPASRMARTTSGDALATTVCNVCTSLP